MDGYFDPNNGNSQSGNAAPFDENCSCSRNGPPSCPIHHKYYYSYVGVQSQSPPLAPTPPHPGLSVQTNGFLHSGQSQPQFSSPTSSMTSPSPNSALFSYTTPGYVSAVYSSHPPMSPSAFGTTPGWFTNYGAQGSSINTHPSRSVDVIPMSSALSPSTAPGYSTQATAVNHGGSISHAGGELPSVPPSSLRSRKSCDVPGCNKSYTATHNLQYHKRSHANVKPYSCYNCGNSYRSQSDLTRHQRRGKTPCISPASPSRN
ncbi:ap-2 repressor [Moniliophthora roreri]|nr:ap-2 repressor [Moniliophthora roreri]